MKTMTVYLSKTFLFTVYNTLVLHCICICLMILLIALYCTCLVAGIRIVAAKLYVMLIEMSYICAYHTHQHMLMYISVIIATVLIINV